MSYVDTQIVPRRIAAKNDRAISISNTVEIKGVSYSFNRVRVLDDAVSVVVPEQFGKMTEESARLKYPSEYRPQCIYTTDDGSINIAFDLSDYPLEKEQIEEKISEWKLAIKRVNPAYVFYLEKIEILNDRKIGYFDFKSYPLDQDLYSLIFITSIGGKLLMGTFNCPFTHYKDWKRLAIQMILSIQDSAMDADETSDSEGAS